MLLHTVKVYPSKVHLPKRKQLAWKIAEIANDNAKLNKDEIYHNHLIKDFIGIEKIISEYL